MKQIAFIAFLLNLAVTSLAQSPAIQWEKSYGGNATDSARCMAKTADGGYIICGATNSDSFDISGFHWSHYSDYWVVKISSSGALQWQKCLGGTGNQSAGAIKQTSDGGYIVAGTSHDTVNGDVTDSTWGYDYWVVKLDDTGAISWQKRYGGTGYDDAQLVLQTADGGYLVAGMADSANGDVAAIKGGVDIWVLKLDDTGAIQWQKSLGGSGDDYATSVMQTSDGGYLFSAYTNSNDSDVTGNHGSNDAWIVKLSSTGSIQWQKCYGGSSADAANSIIETQDSNYVVAGFSNSADGDLTQHIGNSDFWVFKISPSSSLLWQTSFGGLGNEQAQSVAQTTGGGYLVAGWTYSTDGNIIGNHGLADYWVVNLDASGFLLWQKCLGGLGTEQANTIFQTPDGGSIICGTSDSSSGQVTGNHWMTDDFWVAKLYAVSETPTVSATAINIAPNPTMDIVAISGIDKANITVRNSLGQRVRQSNGANRISLSGLPCGLYLVTVATEQGEILKQEKVIKE